MAFILVAILCIGVVGCHTRTASDAPSSDAERVAEVEVEWGQEFIARVHRVEEPDVVRSDRSFELGVFDGLGCPNPFVRFEVTWQDNEATVVVIGKRPEEPVACPMNAPPPMARMLTIMPPPLERVEVVFNALTDHEIRRVVDLTNRRPN